MTLPGRQELVKARPCGVGDSLQESGSAEFI